MLKAAADVRKFHTVRGDLVFNLALSPNLDDRTTKVTYHTLSAEV